MSCGGRVYKGDTVTISVPFEVDDYSNLTITYTTIGGEKIVKTQEEVEIEDGFITYTFEPGELDLLPDGVIYYTIECEVNGVPNVDSTNTNLYLKTPAGYSGRTAEDIYQEGYEAGLEDCSGGTPCDCSSAITEAYQSGYTEGYNQGQEECSGGSCDLQTKYIQLTAHTQTFTAPKGNRPTPPSGVSVVYGGDYEQFVNLVSGNTNSELLIRMWNNDHTANFVVGRFCFVDGSFAFRTSYDTTYIDDILDEWTPINRPAWGSIWLYNDRSNLYMCVSLINEWFFDGYGKEDLILPTKSIDGYDVIHVSSDLSGSSCNLQDDYEIHLNGSETAGQIAITPEAGYDGVGQGTVYYFDAYNAKYNEGYQSGYTAGQADCSGGTCPTETGLINLDSGWSGYESYQPLGSGYYDQVIITDAGYGQRKYDEGYAEGLSSQCDLVPLGVVVHAGDSGVIDNITPDSAAGFSSVSVDARDYGAYLYTSGYNAGLYDCSATTCNLRPFDYQIYPSWDGYMYFPASQASLDGFSSVSIIDLGYGQRKQDEGYNQGYQSGYTDGFQSGYTNSPNRSKIIFKVRNATVIQADLTFLSFSVNGVPVEDVGAIFQTEEIQYTNYTTLWISGYTQPSIITGVEITIKAENIYLNTFNYDWNLFTEINGAEYEAASRSQEFFDIIDDNNKSRRIIYTYTGITLYNEYSFEAGKDYGIEVGKPIGYKEGMDSVIKSVLDENDTDLVIGYYYTSARTNCLITGEYDFPQQDIHIDGNECISAMSINGGVWQPVQKYLNLQSGWTQIRFRVLNGGYRAMFSHFFTPSEECYMDALKVVSIPSGYCAGKQMFRDNEGIRVLSTSCGILSCYRATNLNVVITHYTGNQRQFDYFPSNGVLFIPEGSTADWASILPNWTHIEMF